MSYRAICISQTVWQELVENAFSQLSEEQRPLAETILTTLHDQHIGITPDLIVSLAKTFWPAGVRTTASVLGPPPAESPWSEVCDCLVRAATPLENLSAGYIQAERSRLIHQLRLSPLYTVNRLVAPLIAHVCQRIDLCYLFSHADKPDFISKQAYQKYHNKLIEEIRRITQRQKSDLDSYELFWQDIACLLTEGQTKTLSLPEVDPLTSALFYRLNELPEWTDDQTLRRLHTMITPLQTRHRQEGGVRGIRVSRRLEDIHDIILSEFLNPQLLLVDRLLNSGYFVFEREPKRVKLRDMLLIGIMPNCVRQQSNELAEQSQLSADFAKVCWFNFIAHLGLLLRRYNLWQSEFRWIEGDAWQRVRVESRLLFQLEESKHRITEIILDKTQDTRQQRHHFRQQMNWLPGYLDTRARYQPLKGWNDTPSDSASEAAWEEARLPEKQQLDELVDWVRRVIAQQKDNPDWARLQKKASLRQAVQARPQKFAVADFTFVHIMVFLPAVHRKAWGAETRSLLNLAAQIGRNNPQRNLSVVWTPSLILPPAFQPSGQQEPEKNESGWMYAAPYHRDVSIHQPRDPSDTAAALVIAWLDEIMQEIQHA